MNTDKVEGKMKRQYVKLNEKGMWHVGTKTIWTMCGRSMPVKVQNYIWTGHEPWADVADEPDGPVCKTCVKALAVWERE